jgi:hypothetical protein
MEGFARTSIDINLTTHGQIVLKPMTGNVGDTIHTMLPATHYVFSSVCDMNLIMMSSDQAIQNQCYEIRTPLNS